ncbi:Orofacial cleft 1 candidate gene 1 protein [Heterocephalus glaber]|uniref:Orofacial cleft 1 candidate gene 1 protein n=1 Tax=Heterocephalus glaber TaxID=10181 RepID=G5BN69_HETGA|nr:Orofacial cleft 1 candidate gene 1 protein [Heterocephalus glaber]
MEWRRLQHTLLFIQGDFWKSASCKAQGQAITMTISSKKNLGDEEVTQVERQLVDLQSCLLTAVVPKMAAAAAGDSMLFGLYQLFLLRFRTGIKKDMHEEQHLTNAINVALYENHMTQTPSWRLGQSKGEQEKLDLNLCIAKGKELRTWMERWYPMDVILEAIRSKKFQQKALKQTKQKKSKSAEFLMVKEDREATEGFGNPAFNMSNPDLSAHQTSEEKIIRHDTLDRTLAAHQQKSRLPVCAVPKGNEYGRNYFDPLMDEEINPRQCGMEGDNLTDHSVKEKSTVCRPGELEDYLQDTSYLEELEKHQFSVCSSVAGGSGSGDLFKHLHFVKVSVFSELQFAQWQSQGFWYAILLLASLCFLRLCLHYLGQWLFLQAISAPVTKFHLYPYMVELCYPTSSLSITEELAVIVVGPLMLNTVIFLLVLIRWGCQLLFASCPDVLSKLIITMGLWTVLDPLAVFIVDIFLGSYDMNGKWFEKDVLKSDFKYGCGTSFYAEMKFCMEGNCGGYLVPLGLKKLKGSTGTCAFDPST